MRNALNINPYKKSDKQILQEILEHNIPKYFDPKELQDFVQYLDKYSDTYFTVSADENIKGGFGYVIDDEERTGSITWIFFHPDYCEKGLGTFSLNYCLAILKSNPSVNKILVKTSQHANLFFEKFGFVLIKMKQDYWGKGLDLYSMELQLYQ